MTPTLNNNNNSDKITQTQMQTQSERGGEPVFPKQTNENLSTPLGENETVRNVFSVDNNKDKDKDDDNNGIDISGIHNKVSNNKFEGRRIHGAGSDSFMTGFTFAYFCSVLFDEKTIQSFENKIYLVGKDIPLLLQKTQFSQPSVSDSSKKESIT